MQLLETMCQIKKIFIFIRWIMTNNKDLLIFDSLLRACKHTTLYVTTCKSTWGRVKNVCSDYSIL